MSKTRKWKRLMRLQLNKLLQTPQFQMTNLYFHSFSETRSWEQLRWWKGGSDSRGCRKGGLWLLRPDRCCRASFTLTVWPLPLLLANCLRNLLGSLPRLVNFLKGMYVASLRVWRRRQRDRGSYDAVWVLGTALRFYHFLLTGELLHPVNTQEDGN